MANIKPFKALVYNQEKVGNLAGVVCPPYDIISPEAQERYHNRNPHNLIHILLGKDLPGEDKYSRAGVYFREWLKERIFVQDVSSAVYFYSQKYSIKGETKTRLGFICLLRLGDKSSPVFGHENTRLGPKEDRLRLLKHVRANLSPIFSVFLDNKRIVQRINEKHVQSKKPFIDITDDDKVIHKLWRLNSQEVISAIQSGMLKEDIFIADGHHRYEVACAYRDEMKEKLGGSFTGEEDFNYILSYFTNTDYRGLSILPIHRLLKLGSSLDMKNFLASLSEYFDVEEVKDKTRFFFMMEKGGFAEHVLGMYKDRKYRLLRIKNIKILDKLISDKPKEYRSLDVSILNHIIFKKIMGFDLNELENNGEIVFGPDADEFIGLCDQDSSYISFFLNPVKIQQIIQVASGGNKMPAKSTYFYPKVLSGLVINKFEGS